MLHLKAQTKIGHLKFNFYGHHRVIISYCKFVRYSLQQQHVLCICTHNYSNDNSSTFWACCLLSHAAIHPVAVCWFLQLSILCSLYTGFCYMQYCWDYWTNFHTFVHSKFLFYFFVIDSTVLFKTVMTILWNDKSYNIILYTC